MAELNFPSMYGMFAYALAGRVGWLHDDVIKWKQFPRYRPFVWGIHRSPVNCPTKGQWRGALMFSLACAWINVWVNNREAGNLRRHGTHCDVTVIYVQYVPWNTHTVVLWFVLSWSNHQFLVNSRDVSTHIHQGPLLLAWFNFNPSMDKWLCPLQSVGWNYLSLPNFNGTTVEVWKWISNFIPHFIGYVLAYPCWD